MAIMAPLEVATEERFDDEEPPTLLMEKGGGIAHHPFVVVRWKVAAATGALVFVVAVISSLFFVGAGRSSSSSPPSSSSSQQPTKTPEQKPFAVTQLGANLNGSADGDRFGSSIAMSSDGNRLAVGAFGSGDWAGQVRVFDWNGTRWNQMGYDLDGESADDKFGCSVAMSSNGSRLVVGAADIEFTQGYVRVYDWTGTRWQGSDLDAGPSAGEGFGFSVAISSDGNRVAVGAPYDYRRNGYRASHVRIFDWTGTQWQRQVGSNLDGEAGYDQFGCSVAMSSDGNRLAVGEPNNHVYRENDPGRVHVFDWTGSQWQHVGSVLEGKAVNDWFGQSVAMSSDGNRVAVGAPWSRGEAGQVRVFDWNGTGWQQAGSDLDWEAAFHQFGWSVETFGWSVAMSSDGNRLTVGAPFKDGFGDGHVRVFDWNGTEWQQVGFDLDNGRAGVHDEFGVSVAMSSDGSRLAVGAPIIDVSGDGHVRFHVGQVHVFSLTGGR